MSKKPTTQIAQATLGKNSLNSKVCWSVQIGLCQSAQMRCGEKDQVWFAAREMKSGFHFSLPEATNPWVPSLVKAGRAGTGVYFIQDYESWFFPETDQRARAKVRATYALIPRKIVKSDWLQALLQRDGFSAYKIPPAWAWPCSIREQ